MYMFYSLIFHQGEHKLVKDASIQFQHPIDSNQPRYSHYIMIETSLVWYKQTQWTNESSLAR